MRKRRNAFQSASWLWTPIGGSPTLDANSATWVGYLSAGGKQRILNLFDYGVTLIPGSVIPAVDTTTPRYAVVPSNVPAWGSNPFAGNSIPLPAAAQSLIPPGSDKHVAVLDPVTGNAYGMWSAGYSGGTWSCDWGGMCKLGGNGVDTSGSATATALARYAAVVTASELTAAVAANTGLNHALFCSSDITSSSFVAPAIKSDGDNVGAVATPIPQGKRIQLDPSVNVDGISGITSTEKVIAKTLQTYGAYIGDKGGTRLAFMCEYVGGTTPGTPYSNLGLWDYYDMTKIPWASLRVLA